MERWDWTGWFPEWDFSHSGKRWPWKQSRQAQMLPWDFAATWRVQHQNLAQESCFREVSPKPAAAEVVLNNTSDNKGQHLLSICHVPGSPL